MKKGFSLVELMVTSTLGLLLTATLMLLLMLGRLVWQDSDAKVVTVQEARRGVTEFTSDVTRSSWTSPAGTVCNTTGILVAADGSFICFRVPQSITGSTVTWGDEIRYRRDTATNQLLRENLTTGETRVAANDVNTATFGRLGTDPNVVTVSLRSRKNSLSTRPFESTFQTNVAIRN